MIREREIFALFRAKQGISASDFRQIKNSTLRMVVKNLRSDKSEGLKVCLIQTIDW